MNDKFSKPLTFPLHQSSSLTIRLILWFAMHLFGVLLSKTYLCIFGFFMLR